MVYTGVQRIDLDMFSGWKRLLPVYFAMNKISDARFQFSSSFL